MLKLYNSLGKRLEPFRPVRKHRVTVFTCGPSVYQPAHIGNFRTFLFEDILVRYLEFLGYRVSRGMNFTDIEDKAVAEAKARGLTVRQVTDRNIKDFLAVMRSLRMKIPDYLPRASDHVTSAVDLIQRLLRDKIAYWHRGNVYFDPLRFRGFGRLYGLDMKQWPRQKRRFHQDTYPGVQWNRGDFILWHGAGQCDTDCWETVIGSGRPSWNIQDPSMVAEHFHETLSIYCGGIDNLYRHHDYSIAILESVRSYPMARVWLHGEHLVVDGKKMSKSRGNIIYPESLTKRGYSFQDIRFFLIDAHYRQRLSFTERAMAAAASRRAALLAKVASLKKRAGSTRPGTFTTAGTLEQAFASNMDNDLNVGAAIAAVSDVLRGINVPAITSAQASAVLASLKRIDGVLQVLF